MNKLAIKIENLSKAYQLGEISTGTLSRDLERWWASIRGKQDPFLRIGEANDRNVKSTSNVVWSLKDLNFEIEQGDAIGIIGRNGAGKSTLLKILSRVTAPTTGSVKIKGRIASLLEVGTGFHPELTGRENIFLNGAILGMRKAEIKRKFDEIVDFAGVERYIDTPVKRYSSGMYVRLAFAVAAHLESEILIVDEVLAVGDAEFQKKCLGKMNEVSKGEGRTVLFVSHNVDSIMVLCNKGILLNNGLKVFEGNAINTIQHYREVEVLERCLLEDHPLSEDIILKHLSINKPIIASFEELKFKIHLLNLKENAYSSVALLIYDEYDQKVAFIDLRKDKLFKKASTQDHTLLIEGQINNIPLLPGRYRIGLHIQSTILYKDFFSLLYFKIKQRETIDNILPYPLAERGRMELQYSFNYHQK